jgi:hypothetical protein
MKWHQEDDDDHPLDSNYLLSIYLFSKMLWKSLEVSGSSNFLENFNG